MALTWNNSECPLYLELKEKHGSNEHDDWQDFHLLRESLAGVLMITAFPPDSPWKITEDNWKTVYERISIYEQVAGAMRFQFNANYEKTGLFFTPEEIKGMMNFACNVGNKSLAEFKTNIYKFLREKPTLELRKFLDEKTNP